MCGSITFGFGLVICMSSTNCNYLYRLFVTQLSRKADSLTKDSTGELNYIKILLGRKFYFIRILSAGEYWHKLSTYQLRVKTCINDPALLFSLFSCIIKPSSVIHWVLDLPGLQLFAIPALYWTCNDSTNNWFRVR